MEIRLPSSKSVSARALVINALAEKPCALCNLSDCDDTVALLSVVESMKQGTGAASTTNAAGIANIGAAGTAMRFATALLAATPGTARTLTGTARMLERPIGPLVDALRLLGAQIEYAGNTGYPPLRISGCRLHSAAITVPAHISSQYISALMMIGPTLAATVAHPEGGLTLRLEGHIASRPYIEMTRALMAEWGATTEWRDDHTLYIYAHAYERTAPYEVEADWSAASYFLAADRLAVLPGLKRPSVQGDCVVVDYLRLMDEAVATGKVLELNFDQCPDIAQTLVVAACLAGCAFRYTGLESLRIKETDRIQALINECAKLGWTLLEPAPGSLTWDGTQATPTPVPEHLQSAESQSIKEEHTTITCYSDHRMAMAFALCLKRYPTLRFDHPEVVSKSFPGFWEEFRKVL